MRPVLPALALAAALVAPAHAAPNAATATCTLTYSTLVGVGSGHGTCTAYGSFTGGSLSFTASNGCPQASAAGSATFWGAAGTLMFSFAWTRVGATGTVTTSGGTNGAGTVTFSSPCPANGETAVFSAAGA